MNISLSFDKSVVVMIHSSRVAKRGLSTIGWPRLSLILFNDLHEEQEPAARSKGVRESQ